MDYAELKELQALPLKYKVMITKQRIQEWYEHWDGKVYVSFSGGKDSTVLLHIVRSMYPEVPAVFVDTGLEYPEIRQFVKSVENVVRLRPKMTFNQVLNKYGYPVISKEQAKYIQELRTTKSGKLRNKRLYGKILDNGLKQGSISIKWQYLEQAPFGISARCCDTMKKNPVRQYERDTGNKPIIGIMADEGYQRKEAYMKHGCNAFDIDRPKSTPIGFWIEQDVLQYLLENNLPYASVYGKICKRGGATRNYWSKQDRLYVLHVWRSHGA